MEHKKEGIMNTLKITGFCDEADDMFEEQLAYMNELGVKYIEIRTVDSKNISDLTDEELACVKEQLKQHKIKVSSIGSPMGKIDITDEFAPHMEAFKRTVQIAKMLDTNYIRMFSFFIPEGEEPEKYKDEVFARLQQFVDYAKKENVVLLHENEKGIYGDNATRCAEILKKFYGPHFKAVFDFANFVQVGQDTLKAYALLKDYVVYIHIKDANGIEVVPAGFGEGNVKEILGKFLKNGYQGFLSMEPHLAQFNGFMALEKNGAQEQKSGHKKFMWKIALVSLKSILYDLQRGK